MSAGSEALRFVCFPRIASRDSHFQGAEVFAGRFSEGVLSLVFPTEAVFLQSSAKVFPKPADLTPDQARIHRQARPNSRNLLIIATALHIVNHPCSHLIKSGFKVSEFQGFKVQIGSKVTSGDSVRPGPHGPCRFEKPETWPSLGTLKP